MRKRDEEETLNRELTFRREPFSDQGDLQESRDIRKDLGRRSASIPPGAPLAILIGSE